jgi:hypothetical protein
MSACPSPDGYTLSVNNIYSVEHVDWTAVAAMFAEVGWGQRDPDQIRSAFERSSHVMFIYEAGGVGRVWANHGRRVLLNSSPAG